MAFSTGMRRFAGFWRSAGGFGKGRLAKLGLLVVLIGLTGFAVSGAVLSYRYGAIARQAAEVGDAFEQARHGISEEESLERKYRLEPGPGVLWQRDAAAADV